MKKKYTAFGEYFSNLRKARKQTITEAAELLGVSIAYISAVEHGDREIPQAWRKQIVEIYNLNENETRDLNEAYYNTPSLKRISLADIEWCFTNLINNIAENDEQKEEMMKELKKRLDEFRK